MQGSGSKAELQPTPWPSFLVDQADEKLKPCLCQKVICWIPPRQKNVHVPSHLIKPIMYDLHLCAIEWWSVISFVQSFVAAIPMGETFSLQAFEIKQYIPDDLRLLMWPSSSLRSLSKIVVKEIPCSGTLNTYSGHYRVV